MPNAMHGLDVPSAVGGAKVMVKGGVGADVGLDYAGECGGCRLFMIRVVRLLSDCVY